MNHCHPLVRVATPASISQGSPLPKATSGTLLSVIRHLARHPPALEPLQRAGAIPKLVRFLQWEDDATRESAMRALYNLCKGSKARQEQAAVAGAVPHLIAIAGGAVVLSFYLSWDSSFIMFVRSFPTRRKEGFV